MFPSPAYPNAMLFLFSSGQLHSAVVNELRRRDLSQMVASKEAGIVQPALSKFIARAEIPHNDRGQALSATLLR
jgi:predicted transcriptional regulator